MVDGRSDDLSVLDLELGSACLLASTDDGLRQRAQGPCRVHISRSQLLAISLSWPEATLELPTQSDNCLIIDLSDYVLVVYNAISSDCSVIRFNPESFSEDAFEVFIGIASEYCRFVSREQASQNEVLLALGNAPEILNATDEADQQFPPGLSDRIDSGANIVVSGIQRCSSIICGSLTLGSEFIQRQIEPAAHPMPIHPRIRAGFRAIGSAADAFASGMTNMGENISSSFFGDEPNNDNGRRAPVPAIVRSSIRGAAHVALATTDASLNIFQSALSAATGVLARKYGDGLGEILQDGTRILYSMRLASRALRRVCLQILVDGLRAEPIPYRIS